MVCQCHGELMRFCRDRGRTYWRCAVRARELQAEYARVRRATSVRYRITQRLGRLRSLRAVALDELSQLSEEGKRCGFES